jgi:predicted DNA-binding protein with PD1-like motif
MKYSRAKQGRIFVIRLEEGEIVHEEIEKFASKHSITAAAIIILGGAAKDSKLVVGPNNGQMRPVDPMVHILNDVYEVTGTGTLFPDEEGSPLIHMHISCGRNNETVTGCLRNGVKVWQIMEVVIFELMETSGKRKLDPDLGFKLLDP